MKSSKILSFVVCTHNRLEVLDCLDSFKKLKGENFEVIIIDNKNEKKISEIIKINIKNKKIFQYYYLNDLGLSKARNFGINKASGEYLIFIDDDALIEPNYLIKLRKILTDENKEIIGGKINIKFLCRKPNWLSKKCEIILSALDYNKKSILFGPNDFPIGCNMVIKKSVFDKVGKFNLSLGRTGQSLGAAEEIDFFMRALKYGYPLYYEPNLAVLHLVNNSRANFSYFIKNRFYGGISSAQIRPDIFVVLKLFAIFYNFVRFVGNLDFYYFYMIFGNLGFIYYKIESMLKKIYTFK